MPSADSETWAYSGNIGPPDRGDFATGDLWCEPGCEPLYIRPSMINEFAYHTLDGKPWLPGLCTSAFGVNQGVNHCTSAPP